MLLIKCPTPRYVHIRYERATSISNVLRFSLRQRHVFLLILYERKKKLQFQIILNTHYLSYLVQKEEKKNDGKKGK